jgi:hypothetical protein
MMLKMFKPVAKAASVLLRTRALHGSCGSLSNITHSPMLVRPLCNTPRPPIDTTGDLPPSGIPMIEAEIMRVEAKIMDSERQIDLNDQQLKRIENALSTAEGVEKQTLQDEMKYLRLRDKEKQLQDKEKQLRDEKKQLRDEKKQLRDKEKQLRDMEKLREEKILLQAELDGTKGAPLCLISLTAGSPPHVVRTVLDTIYRLLPDSCCSFCAGCLALSTLLCIPLLAPRV